MTLHFVAITNERFCPGMLALIRSAQAFNSGCRFTVLQLVSSMVPKRWREAFLQAGAEVLVIDGSPIERAISAGAGPGPHRYGPETYAKFLLQDYLTEPFWWLDTDMLVQRKFELDDSGIYGGIAAVAPYQVGVEKTFRGSDDPVVLARLRALADVDRILAEDVALNSGILWMDPVRMGETDILARALNVVCVAHDQLVHADESILNLLRKDYDLRVLPSYVQKFCGYEVPYAYPSEHGPLVHHFMGPRKPWMSNYPHRESVIEYRQWLSEAEINAWVD